MLLSSSQLTNKKQQSLNQVNRTLRLDGLSIVYEHLVYYPTPASFTYFWSFGSLAGFFLIVQLVTGIILVIHYKPSVAEAFNSVADLIYNVPSGWLFRYLHANGASIFFIVIYLHIARGLYYGSYISPRNWVWISGVVIFLVLIGTAFIGYVLPWGQISFWGATVITNLISAIPVIGESIVYCVWGNFSVGDATLNRFFSLHYLLPFVVLALIFVHLYLLHTVGSSNSLAVAGKKDVIKTSFYPLFYIKDIYGVLAFLVVYFYLVFFEPNLLGHSDNYILANPIVTPAHIVPEWYFLPFYAILRSIPNKFGGVVAIVGGIIIILLHGTILRFQRWAPSNGYFYKSISFYPVSCYLYWILVIAFLFLGFIGGRPVEDPYLILGQIFTVFFFSYWIISPIVIVWEIHNFTTNDIKVEETKINTLS